MALQSSGPIRISEISAELGYNSYSLRTLSESAGFYTPDAMSEFYGYSAIPEFQITELQNVYLYDPCYGILVNVYYNTSTYFWAWSTDGITFNYFDPGEYVYYYSWEDPPYYVYEAYFVDLYGYYFDGMSYSTCAPY